MKMIDHNHFICHLILGTFTKYPYETKFNLRPRKLYNFIGKIPSIRNFFTTSCFYILSF